MSVKQTAVTPATYHIDNFGESVQAVTFSYFGVVHSINRRGKRNVLGFLSNAKGTYTLTNGIDRFARMSVRGVVIISATLTDGRTVTHLP